MSGNRSLTLKQRAFLAAYIDPAGANGNGTLAARMAGYRGNNNQLAVQASVNLRKPEMWELLEKKRQELLEKGVRSLSEAMDADVDRAFITKRGEVVHSDPRPDHKTRLQAAKLAFALLGTGTKAPSVPPSENPPVQVSEAVSALDPTDRAVIRDAAKVEAELAQLERDQEDAAHDETGTRKS